MQTKVDWLPPLVLLSDPPYGNDWDKYLDALYAYYKRDFLDSKPRYKCVPIGTKKLPILDGKESGFWHLIQEGDIEVDRIPDLRRCERVCWPRVIIEQCHHKSVFVWPNTRHTASGVHENICMWVEERDYLVVLRKSKKGYLFWTAYPVTKDHTKRKLRREYEAWKKTGDAISSDPDTPSTHGR